MKNIGFGRSYGALSRRTNLFMKEAFKKLDLTFLECIVLIFISENPGVIQDDIASALSVDKAAVTRSVKRLEQHLLIERKEDSNNGRVKKVFPTANAKKCRVKISAVLDHWNDIILADCTEEELDLLLTTFTKMSARAISADIATEVAKIKLIQ